MPIGQVIALGLQLLQDLLSRAVQLVLQNDDFVRQFHDRIYARAMRTDLRSGSESHQGEDQMQKRLVVFVLANMNFIGDKLQ